MLNIMTFGVNYAVYTADVSLNLFKITPATGLWLFGIVFIIALIAGSGRD